jgi:hypothetical protein
MRLALSARRSARVPLAIGLAAIVTAPATGTIRASSASPGAPAARLRLRPAVVRLGGRERIEVSGLRVRSLQVVPVGALEPAGQGFRWRSLRLVHGNWVTTLPAPLLRGVYPLRLRTQAGTRSVRSPTWFLRVLSPGTLSRPSFPDPAEVVRWWVRSVPHGTLVAFKRWPLPAWDRRDARLHRLFVVAYSPPGQPEESARLGMFLTAFRDGYGARWRFLQANLSPDVTQAAIRRDAEGPGFPRALMPTVRFGASSPERTSRSLRTVRRDQLSAGP